jgi:exodeoxyribonuclease VII large subunit
VLDHLAERIALSARMRLTQTRTRLEVASRGLDRAIRRDVDRRRNRLGQLAAALEALSPLAVLARGYSLTFKGKTDGDSEGTGTLVRSADDVQVGDLIQTRLAAGQILSRVEGRKGT